MRRTMETAPRGEAVRSTPTLASSLDSDLRPAVQFRGYDVAHHLCPILGLVPVPGLGVARTAVPVFAAQNLGLDFFRLPCLSLIF